MHALETSQFDEHDGQSTESEADDGDEITGHAGLEEEMEDADVAVSDI